MYAKHFETSVRDAIAPLLGGMGFSLVDLSIGRLRGSTRVCVVIHRKEGVGVDDCAEVSSLILPRLETVEGLDDISLEVSSPGVERTIRSSAEYAIFAGKGVRILAGSATEWFCGIIEGVEGDSLRLRRGTERFGFAIAGIRRARLDHSVEVEEAKNAV